MTTLPITATPVTDWDATDTQWLEERRTGLGGSDVTAALGLSRWRSPFEVWRERRDSSYQIETEPPSEAAALGTALEPWLRDQAGLILDEHVFETPARTYAHLEHEWRRCSPDGMLADGRLVELKTAGVAAGFGPPPGWGDGELPLAYELQVRWSMHVMDAPACEVIALVANTGIVRRTVKRDVALETEMVLQVSRWWRDYIVNDVEPPMGATDHDLLKALYPVSNGETVDLTTTPEATAAWEAYQAARERSKAADADKKAAGAVLKQLIGKAETATFEGSTIATWKAKKGNVDYPKLLKDLESQGIAIPDLDNYRKASSRALSVKGGK